jgi:hypothetical protein
VVGSELGEGGPGVVWARSLCLCSGWAGSLERGLDGGCA